MAALTIPTQTMSTREIAELTGKQHAHVLRDVEKMLAELGDTSLQIWSDLPDAYGRSQRVGKLPKRETLILVSGYNLKMRAKIIDRWQELEARAPTALNLRDPKQLAAAALQLIEVNQELQAKVEQLEPKAEALDRIANAEASNLCITDAAKALQVQPKQLFSWLKDHRWIYRRAGGIAWVGYQDKIQAGLLLTRVTTVERSDGSEKMIEQVLVTPKGLTRLAEELQRADATT